MSIGLLFWIIMIIGIVLWGWAFAQPTVPFAQYHPGVLWVLLALLGWGVFGPPIHG
jgi:hypothetical protein